MEKNEKIEFKDYFGRIFSIQKSKYGFKKSINVISIIQPENDAVLILTCDEARLLAKYLKKMINE